MEDQEKLSNLKLKLAQFAERIDELDPEETDVKDIDELIRMLDELEDRMK
ncbi:MULTISPECIES: SE1561 family protein [Salimicrobium]|uniref:Uncharacterized protein n=3 Tax=Salimicrobium TaxID=351195 RepID=K2HA80_9BACI|nr:MULTISPECIES: SE1561 family protein [Salimicrobium]EKE32515.1 hypothetical protein MJ3_03742 [Salimicrobium jeotgali]MBM7695502.1 hypothetical protein [Salimicrobium jeotgali]SDY15232.1 hypothetical protein SAMN04488081_2227 [Salimicrobium album]SIS77805.1 hypothetical protein SAMN05421758_105210 [Salimicrobium salexigens]